MVEFRQQLQKSAQTQSVTTSTFISDSAYHCFCPFVMFTSGEVKKKNSVSPAFFGVVEAESYLINYTDCTPILQFTILVGFFFFTNRKCLQFQP